MLFKGHVRGSGAGSNSFKTRNGLVGGGGGGGPFHNQSSSINNNNQKRL